MVAGYGQDLSAFFQVFILLKSLFLNANNPKRTAVWAHFSDKEEIGMVIIGMESNVFATFVA